MTIEQKAKAYDKALEKAKDFYKGYKQRDNQLYVGDLEIIFPELKESDDEKIRKAILHHLRKMWGNSQDDICGVNVEDAIAWLEKQGEKIPVFEFKAKDWYVSKVDGKIYNIKYMGKKPTNQARRLEIEKAAMSATGVIQQEEWFIKGAEWSDKNPSYISSEKQDDNKSVKNIVETWKDMRLEVYQQASGNRHELNYSDDTTKMFSLNDIDDIIEKISEQKPIGKVEPKFKVGDWVVKGNTIAQILDIQEQYYVGVDINGKDFTSSRFLNNDKIHLWTIQDAKDGDILVIESGRRNNECLFIFKDIACREVLEHCYYRTNDSIFSPTGSFIGYLNNIYHPATKKQRDLLFQKIKEAEYEWDAEKKELRKTEQKAVSITDEWIEDYWQHEKVINPYSYDKGEEIQFDHQGFVRFCKKYCRKPTWSEEDENMYRKLHNLIYAVPYCDSRKEFSEWLKSLKQRMNNV